MEFHVYPLNIRRPEVLATILFLVAGLGFLLWGYSWLSQQGKVPVSIFAPAIFFLYSGAQLTVVAKQGLSLMTVFCSFLGLISIVWLTLAVQVTRKAQLDYLESLKFESELDQLVTKERESGSLVEQPKAPAPVQPASPPPAPAAKAPTPPPPPQPEKAARPISEPPVTEPEPTPPPITEPPMTEPEPTPPPITEPPMTEPEPVPTPSPFAAPPVTEPEPEPPPEPRVLNIDIALTPEMFNRDVDASNSTISVSIPDIAKRLKNPKNRKRTDPAAEDVQAPKKNLFDPKNGVMLIQSTPGPKNLELIGDLLAPQVGMSAEDTAARLKAYKGPVILNNFNREIADTLAEELQERGIKTLSIPVSETLTPNDLGQITKLEPKSSTVVLTTANSRFEVQWSALYFLEVGVYGQEHDSEKEELVKADQGTLACELFLRQSGKALRFSLLACELEYAFLGEEQAEKPTDNLMLTLAKFKEKAKGLRTGPGYDVLENQGLALAYPCLKSFSDQARGQFQLANAREFQT